MNAPALLLTIFTVAWLSFATYAIFKNNRHDLWLMALWPVVYVWGVYWFVKWCML